MKIPVKIFIVLIFCGGLFKSQAQELSKADLQIIKDIKTGIDSVKNLANRGFKDLIMNGVVAKDTEVVLYNAYSYPLDLLHGSKYSILYQNSFIMPYIFRILVHGKESRIGHYGICIRA
jgi:hypothetical protein